MAAQGLRPEAPGVCHHHYCDGGSNGMNIFVFGSNLAGRHGAGAALTAKMFYGAKRGNGVGMSGNPMPSPRRVMPSRPFQSTSSRDSWMASLNMPALLHSTRSW